MNKLINSIQLLIFILISSNCVSSQTRLQLLFEEVSMALTQARSAHADILCKDKYDEAFEYYRTALDQKNNEYESSDITENLEYAISRITVLNETIDEKQNFFYTALQSRENALENRAEENSEHFFSKAERSFSSSISYYNDGNYEDARNELTEINANYNKAIEYSNLSQNLQYKWLPYKNANLVLAFNLAPIEYNDAMDSFSSALNLLNNGSDMSDIELEIISAEEKFNSAINKANKFRNRYPAIIASRNDALEVNADQYAFRHWNLGEELLSEMAIGETEEEIANSENVAEIISQYRLAKSEANKHIYLSKANKRIKSAEKLEAENYSPISYYSGIQHIDEAARLIENENFSDYEITRLADESIKEANKAILISQIIKSVENGETTWEDILLSWNSVISGRRAQPGPLPVKEEIEIYPEPEIIAEPMQSEYVAVYTDVFTDEEAEVIEEDGRLTIHLTGLKYSPISTKLEFAQRELLDKVIIKMMQYPTSTFQVIGHTDNIGLRADNQKISEQRAKNVYDYLTKNSDIKISSISYSGEGEMNPIADNRTAEGRQNNRRVDIIIIYGDN
jgi:outer membrane protein OmpA-like peptidoglycan-associated protein